MLRRTFGLVCLLALTAPSTVEASFVVDFYRITANSGTDISGQLSLAVYGVGESPFQNVTIGDNQALFVFRNDATVTSSVEEIYLDDGTVIGVETVYNTNSLDPTLGLRDSSGTLLTGLTSFAKYAEGRGNSDNLNPGDLPGGENLSPPFEATQILSTDADNGAKDGLNQTTEAVAILYDIKDIGDGSTAVDRVYDSLATGELRVGLHVRSIGLEGESDSFVNVTPVPEPFALAVWSVLGMVGLAIIRRRNRK